MEATHEHGTWKHWLEAHGPKLLLCARQWTRSLADAEDVVQEAFVRYWRHQRHLPGDPQALHEARHAAVNDYLPKPFVAADLVDVVDTLCP